MDPMSAEIMDDLPAPTGPTTMTNSPGATDSETFDRVASAVAWVHPRTHIGTDTHTHTHRNRHRHRHRHRHTHTHTDTHIHMGRVSAWQCEDRYRGAQRAWHSRVDV
jgi:hypothetical protein